MRRATLAAIERKLFIHDPNRQRLPNRKLMGATNRLPEHPQVTPGQSSRSGVNEIVKIHSRRHNSLPRAGLSSEIIQLEQSHARYSLRCDIFEETSSHAATECSTRLQQPGQR